LSSIDAQNHCRNNLLKAHLKKTLIIQNELVLVLMKLQIFLEVKLEYEKIGYKKLFEIRQRKIPYYIHF